MLFILIFMRQSFRVDFQLKAIPPCPEQTAVAYKDYDGILLARLLLIVLQQSFLIDSLLVVLSWEIFPGSGEK